ncbi:MAG TPA: 3,4-dihydroxyphenylacetate 2,3-dioxygenase [Rhodocyclaceae bacterium]|nr:3,4-dihydroxyphenylacetate 2,3-dioxygenase [Rhodocyclaceae bacterium]HNH34526.1 3,4-dihydroxyphenylacetate 2,3-dioxygenase [Rhodocyclaceae bacterium]
MGELVFAAKVTHVPSMFISEMEGPLRGCRQSAIDGHREIGRRIRTAGADTVVFLDTHWLVNSGYHVNATDGFKGLFTSNEFPHFIQNLPYEYAGNPALGDAIAETATRKGVRTRSHHIDTLDVEYGTLVPLHFMGMPKETRVVSIAGWMAFSSIPESRTVGEAILEAIRGSAAKVALIASGSLSHRIHDNAVVEKGTLTISDEFYKQVDLRALQLWEEGRWPEFTRMLPTYAKTCHGEGWMHDTAMLLGALGWDRYAGRVEVVTPYFESSGTGQVNAVFPLH